MLSAPFTAVKTWSAASPAVAYPATLKAPNVAAPRITSMASMASSTSLHLLSPKTMPITSDAFAARLATVEAKPGPATSRAPRPTIENPIDSAFVTPPRLTRPVGLPSSPGLRPRMHSGWRLGPMGPAGSTARSTGRSTLCRSVELGFSYPGSPRWLTEEPGNKQGDCRNTKQ